VSLSAALSCSGLREAWESLSALQTSKRWLPSVTDSGGVYFVPAFTGLGSPIGIRTCAATIFGLSRGSTRAHIARAALEAIAFQSAELLAAMQKDAAQPLIELRVDGGATANNLLMQFQGGLARCTGGEA